MGFIVGFYGAQHCEYEHVHYTHVYMQYTIRNPLGHPTSTTHMLMRKECMQRSSAASWAAYVACCKASAAACGLVLSMLYKHR